MTLEEQLILSQLADSPEQKALIAYLTEYRDEQTAVCLAKLRDKGDVEARVALGVADGIDKAIEQIRNIPSKLKK